MCARSKINVNKRFCLTVRITLYFHATVAERPQPQIDRDFPEIHYFVNNSGIGGGRTDVEWQGTEDDHEIVMATNYLGEIRETGET